MEYFFVILKWQSEDYYIYIFTVELIFQDKSILEIIQDPEGKFVGQKKGHTCKLKMLLQIKNSTCKLKIVHAN